MFNDNKLTYKIKLLNYNICSFNVNMKKKLRLK